MEPEDLDGKSLRVLARERRYVCRGPGVARRGAVHVH